VKPADCRRFAIALVSASLALPGQTPSPPDLTQISLEDLMNIQVTSVSKKAQSISKVASAVYVIEAEDVRRSGATNIPDLLRTVPGVNVAQIDAHTWAISIRGFNERFTRSVLVLIDGRTVYSPLSGGVNWDQQNVPLEDIDRIEVIRGPGGTVWGANAVNGVINITTRSAAATKGGLIRVGGGSQQSAGGLAQYGSAVGNGAYRVSEDYSHEGNGVTAEGQEADDGWHTLHGAIRTDWTLSPRDTLTVEGDISSVVGGQTAGSPISPNLLVTGVHDDLVVVDAQDVLSRWNRVLSAGSDFSLQIYFDRYNRLDSGFREIRDTVDVDFHHHVKLGSRNDIVWGLGYRVTSDNLNGSAGGNQITYTPPRSTDSLFSGFIQDELRLTNSLSVTFGSKLEHNAYTGVEFEPSAQLAWQPTDRQEVWISVARAIRQPTRTDVGVDANYAFQMPGGGAGTVVLTGDPHPTTAKLHDYEIGYRVQPNKKVSVDVSTFLSYYHNLLTVEPQSPFFSSTPVPQLVVPEAFGTLANARSFGGEIASNWRVTSRWKIVSGYSLVRIKVGLDPSSEDVTADASANATPEHQFQVRSSLNLTRNTDLDSSLSYVSALRGLAATPGYERFDTRLAQRLGNHVEISLVGQNLLSGRHAEFADSEGLLHTLERRSVSGAITWRF